MKKWVKPFVLVIVLTLFLAGCSAFEKERSVLVIGNERDWDDSPIAWTNQLENNKTFEIKKEEVDGKKIVYMSRQMADILIDERLLRVKTDKKYKAWRRIDSERPLLSFATSESVLPEEIRVTTSYSGDLAIGDERFDYADVVIIADVDSFEDLDLETRSLALLQFKEERLAQLFTHFEDDIAIEAFKVVN